LTTAFEVIIKVIKKKGKENQGMCDEYTRLFGVEKV